MTELDRRTLVRGGGLAAVAALLAGCGRQEHPVGITDRATAPLTPATVDAVRMAPSADIDAGKALTDFGVALLQSAAYDATGDVALSPYSVYAALAMTAAGARGATADQFAHLLGGDAAAAAGRITAIDRAVEQAVQRGRQQDSTMAVDPANTVVVQQDLAVRAEFLRQLAAGFAAGAQRTDFVHGAETARAAINDWVGRRTHDLIPELLGPGTVDSSTRLVLVNALYLKARWAAEFSDPKGSKPFTAADGSRVRTPMMANTGWYAVNRGTDWRSVRIPYVGGRLAMTVVLPEPGAFAAVRNRLASVLGEATAEGERARVALSLPPFSVDSAAGLTQALRALGLRDAFDTDRVDLSGIAGPPHDLTVSFVQHQAVMKVDQHGTEAAAATAVGVMAGAAPQQQTPEPFVVDRAFFLVVHDTSTGAPLFLGQISRPKR